MGVVARKADQLAKLGQYHTRVRVIWNYPHRVPMGLHSPFIVTSEAKLTSLSLEKKRRIFRGVRVVTVSTSACFKGGVKVGTVCLLTYLLMAGSTHLALGKAQVVFLVGTVGTVADRANAGSHRAVNVGFCELVLFALVTAVAQIGSCSEKLKTGRQ